MFYALIPYSWVTLRGGKHAHWELPTGVSGAIDLRPRSARTVRGGTPAGYAFTTARELVSGGVELSRTGRMAIEPVTPLMRDAWLAATGYRPNGATIADLLGDQLTAGSDPSGESGPKPLVPESNGNLRIHVPDNSVVWRERFRWGVHPHTNRLRDLLRRDVRGVFEADHRPGGPGEDRGTHRRMLDDLRLTYRGADWREFVPPDLLPHVRGPLPRATTYLDDFNRTDSTGLGTASSGGTWEKRSAVSGTLDVASNQMSAFNATTDDTYYRLNSDLSGSNNYAQFNLTALGSGSDLNLMGTFCRWSGSADDAYAGIGRSDAATLTAYAVEADVLTSIGSQGVTFSLPEVIRTEANGSTIRVLQAGVERVSVTNTAISTGLRGGVYGVRLGGTGVTADDFDMSDLAGGAAGHPSGRRLGATRYGRPVEIGRDGVFVI